MTEHPAKFSVEILETIKDVLATYSPPPGEILDPFAGIGRIHNLRALGYLTVGVELETEWARITEWTQVGDATNLPDEWRGRFAAVITSPPYANRMADRYAGDPRGSRRHTYRVALGRPLTKGSAAGMQWGKEYKDAMVRFLVNAKRVLQPGGLFVLNISNHVRGGDVIEVSEWFAREAERIGFQLVEKREIPTKRLRNGANAELRVPHEDVYVFRCPNGGTL